MSDGESWARFEMLAMPHLDAAYNLARWLTRNDHDAQDVVQEAMVRAMRYIGGLRSEGARAWLLQIVRHTCYSWLTENRPAEKVAARRSDAAGATCRHRAPTSRRPSRCARPTGARSTKRSRACRSAIARC
jgi:RNA polymerase sigma-70 factor (ECF subfamily)